MYSVGTGNEIKADVCVTTELHSFTMRKRGGVYGKIYTIPNTRINDFTNCKRSLISNHIYNVDE